MDIAVEFQELITKLEKKQEEFFNSLTNVSEFINNKRNESDLDKRLVYDEEEILSNLIFQKEEQLKNLKILLDKVISYSVTGSPIPKELSVAIKLLK